MLVHKERLRVYYSTEVLRALPRYPVFAWLIASNERLQLMRRVCNEAIKMEQVAPLEYVHDLNSTGLFFINIGRVPDSGMQHQEDFLY